MPILTSQPEATDSLATHHATLQRHGGTSIGSNVSPPRDLLPSGGVVVPAPVPAPARALALDALRLLRRLGDPARRPERWCEAAFSREIELVRIHLAPLRTRKALAASYGREAFHLTLDGAARDNPGAVRLAYALRWLELGHGAASRSWPAILEHGPA